MKNVMTLEGIFLTYIVYPQPIATHNKTV